MKKNFWKVCLVLVLGILVVGCTTSKTVQFEVSTGDNILVKLDTSDKYDITVNVPFAIMHNDEKLSDGTFITLDDYQTYLTGITTNSSSKVIDSGEKDGITYTFYSYNNKEYNYLIKVNNSSTAILLGNIISEQSAKECFDRLSFSKK